MTTLQRILLVSSAILTLGVAVAAPIPDVLRKAQPDDCKRTKCKCGCADGKECDCIILDKQKEAQAEAEFWITAPGLQRDAMPKTLSDAVQKEVEAFCLAMELYSNPEPWRWDKESDHGNWLFWARFTYESRYKDADEFPDIEEASRLPRYESACAAVTAASEHITWLYSFEYKDENNWAQQWETGERCRVWESIRDATDTSKHDLVRRRAMHKLRELTTPEVYYSGNWPTPYDFPRFRR